MSLAISAKCQAIAPSATFAMENKAKELKLAGVDVVSFAAGEPDFDTPAHIREAMKEAMDLGMTRYTMVPGTLELRDAVAYRLKADHGLVYGRDEIIASNGAKECLYLSFQALLDPGDEVLIPSPCWVSYPEMVRMAGGVPVFVEAREENGFLPTEEAILQKLSPKTKAFMLTTPNNPNGCIYGAALLETIARLAVERGFYIISDEIYQSLVYGVKHVCIATLNDQIKAQTLLINGVSKSYAMTGFRIGYVCGPRNVIKAMTTYQSQATSGPNSAAQHAAAVALVSDQGCVEEMRRAFQARRDRMVELINRIDGVSCLKPQGAFYVMMNVKDVIGKRHGDAVLINSATFAETLLNVKHVVTVSGSAFMAEGYCRLSYATSMDNVEEGIGRIAAFVKELR